MAKTKDLVGTQFGNLIVVVRGVNTDTGRAQWMCRCLCGNPKLGAVRADNLTSGKTISCGCQKQGRPVNTPGSTGMGRPLTREAKPTSIYITIGSDEHRSGHHYCFAIARGDPIRQINGSFMCVLPRCREKGTSQFHAGTRAMMRMLESNRVIAPCAGRSAERWMRDEGVEASVTFVGDSNSVLAEYIRLRKEGDPKFVYTAAQTWEVA